MNELRKILTRFPIYSFFLPKIEKDIKKWALGLLPKVIETEVDIPINPEDLEHDAYISGHNEILAEIRKRIEESK